MRRPSYSNSFGSALSIKGFVAVVGVFFLSGGGAVGERAVSSSQRLDLPRARTAQRFRAWRLSGTLVFERSLAVLFSSCLRVLP